MYIHIFIFAFTQAHVHWVGHVGAQGANQIINPIHE